MSTSRRYPNGPSIFIFKLFGFYYLWTSETSLWEMLVDLKINPTATYHQVLLWISVLLLNWLRLWFLSAGPLRPFRAPTDCLACHSLASIGLTRSFCLQEKYGTLPPASEHALLSEAAEPLPMWSWWKGGSLKICSSDQEDLAGKKSKLWLRSSTTPLSWTSSLVLLKCPEYNIHKILAFQISQKLCPVFEQTFISHLVSRQLWHI
jgi:hypothetical protein